MQAARQTNWKQFVRFFNEQNAGRPTRLGVFEDDDDYWLEDGVPLTGIDVDPREDHPSLQIMLARFTHTVKGVRKLTFHVTVDGNAEGLDITNAEGSTTILRFEQ
jgi:hypothetical protein